MKLRLHLSLGLEAVAKVRVHTADAHRRGRSAEQEARLRL